MKLSKRSFPHPVLGNADDVPGAAFQATLEMEVAGAFAYINVHTTCSSETIKNYIEEGKAQYVLHIECSNTMHRQAIKFANPKESLTIEINSLNDDVEVNCFVCAIDSIDGYRVDGMHEDYGNATFTVLKGDVLAAGETVVFTIEPKFDSSRRIGSIMQIQEQSKDGDLPMQVDIFSDKINIFLSKSDFAAYKSLKSSESLLISATTAITLPVLIEAIRSMDDSKMSGDLEEFRWFRSLSKRITNLGLDKEPDAFVKAQRILDLPLKQVLGASTKLMIDVNG